MENFLSGLFSTLIDNAISAPLTYLTGFFKNLLAFIIPNTVVPLLNNVMAYQNFFSEGVNAGWTITRDFSNLFFALILLIIAIATVLQVGPLDNYTAKRMLPNFIFVALFINFSKAIVGFLIDISQIIMISFYNSFGPSMADTLGKASQIAEAAKTSNTDVLFLNIFTIVILAFLTFILLWTALILAMRIVTLWFIIMLAPLAFMATLVPGLKSISDDWKNKLQESLVTGPTLMFFLYLAFTLMSKGISANPTITGDNLMTNGNLINYVLVIGLLFLANATATKAGQAAPPFLKSAVAVAGTTATFGLGKYVGAGGYGTKQFADTSVGGITTIFGQNPKYEAAKKDFKDRQASGTGIFGKPKINGKEYNINPFRLARGLSDEGKKNIQDDYESNYATELAAKGKLDDPKNERYRKIYNTNLAKETKELDESGLSLVELRKKLYEAIQNDDLKAKQATLLQITKLGELGKIFEDDGSLNPENIFFKDIAQNNATEGEMVDTLIKKIETNKSGTMSYAKSSIAKDFRTRLKRVGVDKKGQVGFLANIENPGSATVGAGGVINKGLVNAIEEINKNPNLFRERDGVAGAWTLDKNNGKPKFNAKSTDILSLIARESSLDTLRDPKTWQKLNPTSKTEFFQVVDNEIRSNPNGANVQRYQAAKQGLTS
jgi:hypothetical protein